MKAPKNVTVWLDSLDLNRFHVLVMFLAGFTLIFDGYDSQIIAYIMPQAIKEWRSQAGDGRVDRFIRFCRAHVRRGNLRYDR